MIYFGININAQDLNNDKRTALHHAILNKKIRIARFLLENNADATLKDAQGNSAEDYINESASNEIKELGQQLLENRAFKK